VVVEEFDGSLESMFDRETGELRRLLLSVWGIGEETADDIILYAAEKPSFVIDKYTMRVVDRLGWNADGKRTYAEFQIFFESRLPPDVPLFNEFHAVLDAHAARTCKKLPVCGNCCLSEICETGKANRAAVRG
jgi:endonuclease-3 related protein